MYGEYGAEALGDSEGGVRHGCHSTALPAALVSARMGTPQTSFQNSTSRLFMSGREDLREYCESLRRQIESMASELQETKAKVQALERDRVITNGLVSTKLAKSKIMKKQMDIVLSSLKNLSIDQRLCHPSGTLVFGTMSPTLGGPATPIQASPNVVKVHAARSVDVEHGSKAVHMLGVADVIHGTPTALPLHDADGYREENDIHRRPVIETQTDNLSLPDYQGVGGDYIGVEHASEKGT